MIRKLKIYFFKGLEIYDDLYEKLENFYILNKN
jgi:hypothetical protein